MVKVASVVPFTRSVRPAALSTIPPKHSRAAVGDTPVSVTTYALHPNPRTVQVDITDQAAQTRNSLNPSVDNNALGRAATTQQSQAETVMFRCQATQVSGEPFPAPAPSQLLTYYIVPTSTSYATVAASHNLSAGAAAGIGVGAALGTCLVGIGAGFLMLRRRRHRRQPTEGPLSQHDNKEPEQPQQQLRGAEGGYPGAPGAYDMGLQELEPRSRQLRELQG
ncbi:hypothetical protein PG987_008822 [Apiospora arundinis]